MPVELPRRGLPSLWEMVRLVARLRLLRLGLWLVWRARP